MHEGPGYEHLHRSLSLLDVGLVVAAAAAAGSGAADSWDAPESAQVADAGPSGGPADATGQRSRRWGPP